MLAITLAARCTDSRKASQSSFEACRSRDAYSARSSWETPEETPCKSFQAQTVHVLLTKEEAKARHNEAPPANCDLIFLSTLRDAPSERSMVVFLDRQLTVKSRGDPAHTQSCWTDECAILFSVFFCCTTRGRLAVRG